MALSADTERAEKRTVPSSPGPSADVRAALQGMGGGALGTAMMSALMLAAHKAGLMGRLPPERITQRLFFRGFRRARRQNEKDMLAGALHVGFGVAAGSLFGVARLHLFARAGPLALGALGIGYGTVIWFVSYMGWVPALGLMPPAQRDRPDRQTVMVLAHWLFGATLGLIVGMLSRGERPH